MPDSTPPSQTLVVADAEIVHKPATLSPKALATAIGGIVAVIVLNVLVLVLTGELPLDTVLPTLGTAVAATVAAYIKREIIPKLEVPVPEDMVLLDRGARIPTNAERFVHAGSLVPGETAEIPARR